MLPKQNRLRSQNDIKNVFANGKSTRCGFLFLKSTHNSLNVTRFAFSVGLSYSKAATKRNVLRRKLRSIVLKHINDIAEGFDCVFFVKKAPHDNLDKKILVNSVNKCLYSLNLQKK